MNEILSKPIRRKSLLAALRKWRPGSPDLEDSAILADVVAPPKTTLMPQLSGIDVEETICRLGLPWTMLRTMLFRLADALPARLSDLRQAINAHDSHGILCHTHSIAAAAGSAGATKVHDRAMALGKAATEEQPEKLEKLFSALSEELDVIVFSIEKLKS